MTGRAIDSHAASGSDRIAAERKRQIEAHAWTSDHDDVHDQGELAIAAACYATPVPIYCKSDEQLAHNIIQFTDPWPWGDHEDRRKGGGNVPIIPTDREPRIRMLEKAGALIAAEIDRLLRLDP